MLPWLGGTRFSHCYSNYELISCINFLLLKVVYKSYQKVIKVHFIITTTEPNLPQKSTIQTLTPVALSIWKFPLVAFLCIIHSLYTVQRPTNQMNRDDIVCSRLAQQMHGLSWALWERRKNFGVQWTGTDIVLRWCEAKPASFPGWKPFQCLSRFHLHREIRAKPEQNRAKIFQILSSVFRWEHDKLILYVQNIAVEGYRMACNYTHILKINVTHCRIWRSTHSRKLYWVYRLVLQNN